MKLINFCASINKNSDELICQSDKDFLSIDESFTVRIEDEFYGIRKIDKKEVWFDFKNSEMDGSRYLIINELEEDQFYPRDYVEIYFSEYQAQKYGMVIDGGKGYEKGQTIVFAGYGGVCNFKIAKVGDQGEVLSLSIENVDNFLCSGHREILVEGGGGEGLKVIVEFLDTKKKTMVTKEIRSTFFSKGNSYLDFEYPIEQDIDNGQIKIYRSSITLDKKNLNELPSQVVCIAEKINYTPKLKIPIVERGTLNAYRVYNEGATIIEDKFMELEKRIIDLESKL